MGVVDRADSFRSDTTSSSINRNSNTSKSIGGNKPRVSFNKDVHVKRINSRRGLSSGLAGDSEGRFHPVPIRKEPLADDDPRLILKTALRLGKYSTLPARRGTGSRPSLDLDSLERGKDKGPRGSGSLSDGASGGSGEERRLWRRRRERGRVSPSVLRSGRREDPIEAVGGGGGSHSKLSPIEEKESPGWEREGEVRRMRGEGGERESEGERGAGGSRRILRLIDGDRRRSSLVANSRGGGGGGGTDTDEDFLSKTGKQQSSRFKIDTKTKSKSSKELADKRATATGTTTMDKKKGLDIGRRMKELFSIGSGNKKNNINNNNNNNNNNNKNVERDQVKARFTEYKGRTRISDGRISPAYTNDETDTTTDYERWTMVKGGTKSTSSTAIDRSVSSAEKPSKSWFRSLERKKASSSNAKGTSKREMSTSVPNFRYFGDSEAENDYEGRRRKANFQKEYGSNSRNRLLLSRETSDEGTPLPSRRRGSGASASPSVVFLHSAAIGDIPGSKRQSGGGASSVVSRTSSRLLTSSKSKEELRSIGRTSADPEPSYYGRTGKTLTRSVSVLAPWTPRFKKEIDYSSDQPFGGAGGGRGPSTLPRRPPRWKSGSGAESRPAGGVAGGGTRIRITPPSPVPPPRKPRDLLFTGPSFDDASFVGGGGGGPRGGGGGMGEHHKANGGWMGRTRK